MMAAAIILGLCLMPAAALLWLRHELFDNDDSDLFGDDDDDDLL